MFSQTIIVGRLGQDPELNHTKSGSAVANISVATDYSVKRDDKWEKKTDWHRVVLFGKNAENTDEYCEKGSLVLIAGQMRTRSWEDRDGNKRYNTELIAREIKFLTYKSDGERRASGGGDGGGGGDGDPGYGSDDIPF